MNKRTLLAAACSAIAIGALPLAGAQAQDAYPDKPIRVIMPWAAGGPTDVVGRVIAVRMGEILGQPLVIESRPGASGTIGAAQVARAGRRLHRADESVGAGHLPRPVQEPDVRPDQGFPHGRRAGHGADGSGGAA
ncbi:tripartite tricarboxylate transporter substrate-binding protein [Achromobacter xylosoxidans]